MTVKSSGLWCDLCNKPLFFDDLYWHCAVNGKSNCHACEECKQNYEKQTEAKGE